MDRRSKVERIIQLGQSVGSFSAGQESAEQYQHFMNMPEVQFAEVYERLERAVRFKEMMEGGSTAKTSKNQRCHVCDDASSSSSSAPSHELLYLCARCERSVCKKHMFEIQDEYHQRQHTVPLAVHAGGKPSASAQCRACVGPQLLTHKCGVCGSEGQDRYLSETICGCCRMGMCREHRKGTHWCENCDNRFELLHAKKKLFEQDDDDDDDGENDTAELQAVKKELFEMATLATAGRREVIDRRPDFVLDKHDLSKLRDSGYKQSDWRIFIEYQVNGNNKGGFVFEGRHFTTLEACAHIVEMDPSKSSYWSFLVRELMGGENVHVLGRLISREDIMEKVMIEYDDPRSTRVDEDFCRKFFGVNFEANHMWQ